MFVCKFLLESDVSSGWFWYLMNSNVCFSSVAYLIDGLDEESKMLRKGPFRVQIQRLLVLNRGAQELRKNLDGANVKRDGIYTI